MRTVVDSQGNEVSKGIPAGIC